MSSTNGGTRRRRRRWQAVAEQRSEITTILYRNAVRRSTNICTKCAKFCRLHQRVGVSQWQLVCYSSSPTKSPSHSVIASLSVSTAVSVSVPCCLKYGFTGLYCQSPDGLAVPVLSLLWRYFTLPLESDFLGKLAQSVSRFQTLSSRCFLYQRYLTKNYIL